MKKRLHTQDQINEMRKRLYARQQEEVKSERHELSDTTVEVPHDWQQQTANTSAQTTDLRAGMRGEEATATETPAPKKRHYRSFVLIGSLLIFIFVAGISSLYLYFGGNQISNENIQISVQGPPLIGGGEVVSLSVSVANQNTVPIESATLILRYPVGTRSVGDTPRNLFEERIPIDDLAPGEVRNVPVRVAVFGEENAEKNIEATIEYRISGSNGMFYKDAAPLSFRISSSPLVLRVESIEKVASGQLVDVTLTVDSNASSPLEDILVTASYPNGFSFDSSEPAPVYGQNVWRIDKLEPEGEETITLTGEVEGLTEETLRINFDAGPSNPDNQYLVGSVLAEGYADFIIERPFIDVDVAIAGGAGEVVLPQGSESTVRVDITNTLDETVYDMTVEVVPSGNALNEDSIRSTNGFYDSNTETVRWEVSNNESFERVLPGSTRSLSFDVSPGPVRATASFGLEVNVYARRVGEQSAQETLIGTIQTEAKYASNILLGSQAGRNLGRFGDDGPIPPEVGETTTYTLTVVAEAGANDITDAVVETDLPVYVNWLNQYEAPGEVTYNSVSKDLSWEVGDLSAGERKELMFQVSITPSISQLEHTPVLLKQQRLEATDRFTGTRLQDTAAAVTTELSTEMGYEFNNGTVIR